MKKNHLNFLLFLILIAIAVCTYLTLKHFHHLEYITQTFTQKAAEEDPSICNINSTFNCDQVLASSYASFGSISVAGLGLVYFLYLFLPSLYARLNPDRAQSLLALPFLSSIIALGFVGYFAYVSSAKINALCLFCISIYLFTFLIFLILKSVLNLSFAQIPSFIVSYIKDILGLDSSLKFDTHFFVYFLYTVLFMGLGLLVLVAQENPTNKDMRDFDREALLRFFYLQKPASINPEGRPYWGNKDAKVKIIEFSDFECPHCKIASLNIIPRLKGYEDKVALYFFNFPLDKSCNRSVKGDLHDQACRAAKAAICANSQGKFWEYQDKLFEHLPDYAPEQLKDYAQRVGLNLNDWETCLNSDQAQQRVLDDIEAGIAVPVKGTPTILINGRKIGDWMNPYMLHTILDAELKSNLSN